MAYKVSRSSRIIETLELCDERGNVVHSLDIGIDAEAVLSEYNKNISILRQTEHTLKLAQSGKDTAAFDKAAEEYGNAIITLFKVLFGEENTEVILDFYENRYIEMAVQIMPFIKEVLSPALTAAAMQKKQQLINSHNHNKHKRRFW